MITYTHKQQQKQQQQSPERHNAIIHFSKHTHHWLELGSQTHRPIQSHRKYILLAEKKKNREKKLKFHRAHSPQILKYYGWMAWTAVFECVCVCMREQRFKFTLVDIVYSMVVVAGLVLYAKQGRIAKLKNILSHIRSLSLSRCAFFILLLLYTTYSSAFFNSLFMLSLCLLFYRFYVQYLKIHQTNTNIPIFNAFLWYIILLRVCVFLFFFSLYF